MKGSWSGILLTSTRKGPFSLSSPNIEEEPGPPCSHTMRGAVSGSTSSARKNQKNMLASHVLLTVMNPLKLVDSVSNPSTADSCRTFWSSPFSNRGEIINGLPTSSLSYCGSEVGKEKTVKDLSDLPCHFLNRTLSRIPSQTLSGSHNWKHLLEGVWWWRLGVCCCLWPGLFLYYIQLFPQCNAPSTYLDFCYFT